MIVMMFFLGIFLSILLCGSFGYAIVEPLATACRSRKHLRGNFHLSDFMTLIVVLAIPMTLFSTLIASQRDVFYADDVGEIVAIVVAFLLFAAFGFAWWRGTVALSQVGVTNTTRRFVYLAILIPLALIGSASVLPFLCIAFYNMPNLSIHNRRLWFLSAFVTIGVVYLGRKAAIWVVADAETETLDKADTRESDFDVFSDDDSPD